MSVSTVSPKSTHVLLLAKSYINQVCLVPRLQIMHHGGFIEVRELGHIICLVEFGRIDRIDIL